jgi:dipeptidyl aminopeptidase/acylaminoacyl peptidase
MRATVVILFLANAITAPLVRAQQAEQSEREAMYYRYLEFRSYVKGGSIQPHWMADGSSFWYAEGVPDSTVIYRVDPKSHTIAPFIDERRLREALTPLLTQETPQRGLPFDDFDFVNGESTIQFIVDGQAFSLQLDTYLPTPVTDWSEEDRTRLTRRILRRDVADHATRFELLSPDSSWFAGTSDHNLYVRATRDGDDAVDLLTDDGSEDIEWEVLGREHAWSPGSSKIALKKVDYREVPKIPVPHWLGPTEEIEWVNQASSFTRTRAGMPLPHTEIFVIDIGSGERVRVDTGADPDQHLHIIGWRRDGSEVLFLRAQRQLRTVELMAADPQTGTSRVILTERRETFVSGVNLFFEVGSMFHQLADGKHFIWMSERDGWNHLYLYDFDGRLIRRLTRGTFPGVGIEAVDDKGGWVYFTAHGDEARPYDTHLYRVSLEGTEFGQLTDAPGRHEIEFSPSREFFLDTHSSPDRPPRVELRRADGVLLRALSVADISGLEDLGWRPADEFTIKAADGKTDLYGLLWKPYDFDADLKYPVIEYIYGCPQVAVVPRSFTHWEGIYPQALAQLGFVVFVVDARGTPERGKAFQDVAYGNMGRHEIPDHVGALRQLIEQRPYMDGDRVGIFGHSCGGYFTIRALLLAPDAYHVGVASAPVVELEYGNAMEVYMGPPDENRGAYEYASNVRFAGNLEGKLFLIHGTSDFAAPLSGTMKMVEALIQAGEAYDLLLFPEQDHGLYGGSTGTYWQWAVRRYFQEHLKPELGSEPGRTGGR